MDYFLLIVFYLGFPFLIILWEKKSVIIQKINPIVLLYIVGLIIGNFNLLPEKFFPLQDNLSSISVLLALPLLLLSLNISSWKKLAKSTLISFIAMCIAIGISVIIGYLILKNNLPEANKIGGLLIGVYTGGTPNLAAIKLALKVSPSDYIAVHTADILISSIYLLFIVTIAQKLFNLILPKFKKVENKKEQVVSKEEIEKYEGIFTRDNIFAFIKLMLIDIVIVGLSFGLTLLLKKVDMSLVIILSVTTLGTIASLIKPFKNIKNSFQVGQYFILVFCLVVGSMANLVKMLSNSPYIILYVTIAIFGSLIIHLILCYILKIDIDTMIITSIAGIFSPPFVPLVSSVLKNKEIIFSGITAGLIGYAIGNYYGVFMVWILKFLG